MNDATQRILRNNSYATLSTICEDGSPWATPVHFAYDNTQLYWFSTDTTQHSQNVARDHRVFVTIFDSRQMIAEPEDRGALYIQSEARKLEGEELARAREVFADRFEDEDNRRIGDDSIAVYAAAFGTQNMAKSQGQLIYYTTRSIEVTV